MSLLLELQKTAEENHPAIKQLERELFKAAKEGLCKYRVPKHQSWWSRNSNMLIKYAREQGLGFNQDCGIQYISW